MIDCIPGYRLLTEIGRGAFGVVWQAEETATGRHVALKTLPKSKTTDRELDGIRSYFRARLRHPAIVEIFHVNETTDFFYYTMELADDAAVKLDGTPRDAEIESYHPHTLRLFLKREAPVSPTRSLEIAEQILGGLAYLHANSLIHRDVKPENILFVNGQVKLGDWGLVASSDGNVTMIGTPGYIPPDAPLDHTMDLYAAGKILYEMVTGLDVNKFPDPSLRQIRDRAELRDHGIAMQLIDIMVVKREKRANSANAVLEYMALLRSPSRMRRRRLQRAGVILAVGAVLGWSGFRVTSWLARGATSLNHQQKLIKSIEFDNVSAEDGGFRVKFADSSSHRCAFKSSIRSFARGRFWFDKPCIAVGFDANGPEAGKLMVFDESDCLDSESPTPLFATQHCNPPPAEWDFQDHPLICHMQVIRALDVDGIPGEELIVATQHDDGPSEIIILGKGGRQIGSYWHYGWINQVEILAPERLAFLGIANRRATRLPRGRRDEALHYCVLVLDWTILKAANGHWGSSDWLCQGSGTAPIAYGALTHPCDPDGAWAWATPGVMEGVTGPMLRVGIHPDLQLDLLPDLSPIRSSYMSGIGKKDVVPPSVDSLWQRTWPKTPESAKDGNRAGE